MGTGSFPGVKSDRDVTLNPHPFYCRGQERVELYVYFPYGPYGLYRASVPLQGCTLPLPLLYWTLSVVGFKTCLIVEGRSRSMFLPVTVARSPVTRASLPTELSRFVNDTFVHPPHKKSVFFFCIRVKEVRSEILLVINIELQSCGMRRRPVW